MSYWSAIRSRPEKVRDMGHLADALKKAEKERGRFRQAGVSGTPTLTVATSRTDRLRESADGTPPDSAEHASTMLPTGRSILHDMVIPLRTAGPGPRQAWAIHPSVVAYHDRASSITEQFRAVRTWL